MYQNTSHGDKFTKNTQKTKLTVDESSTVV